MIEKRKKIFVIFIDFIVKINNFAIQLLFITLITQ